MSTILLPTAPGKRKDSAEAARAAMAEKHRLRQAIEQADPGSPHYRLLLGSLMAAAKRASRRFDELSPVDQAAVAPGWPQNGFFQE